MRAKLYVAGRLSRLAEVLRRVQFDVTRCSTCEYEDCSKMKWFMHPLLTLIANATESEMARYVEYLKVENQIHRDRSAGC